MKYAGKVLIILGVVYGLFGIRSFLREYSYQKGSIVVKATILSVEIKDNRTNGNYYLKPTHHITHHLRFLRDGNMDTLSEKSNFLLYPEGKTINNPNKIPSVGQLMKQEKYVRYVPKSKKKETSFPDRIDINNNGEYESFNSFQYFFSMASMMLLGLLIRYFSKK
ncbi:hypothetical protein [Sphingobacterium kyonggiense]